MFLYQNMVLFRDQLYSNHPPTPKVLTVECPYQAGISSKICTNAQIKFRLFLDQDNILSETSNLELS